MLVPWFTATMRGVLPRLIASGVVSEDEIAMEDLTDRLRQAVVESRSQIEFAPQMCAWTHVWGARERIGSTRFRGACGARQT